MSSLQDHVLQTVNTLHICDFRFYDYKFYGFVSHNDNSNAMTNVQCSCIVFPNEHKS